MRNLSYENEVYPQVRSNAYQTRFHMKGFALGLGLKMRQKATWNGPASVVFASPQTEGPRSVSDRGETFV